MTKGVDANDANWRELCLAAPFDGISVDPCESVAVMLSRMPRMVMSGTNRVQNFLK